MTRFRLYIVFAALLPLSTAAAQDTVYKWADPQGRTHYSDQRPDVVENPETVPVFDAPEIASSPSAAYREELKRIRELSEELEAARKERETERLERRLAALERAYYQELAEREERRDRDREINILYPGLSHRFHPFPVYPFKKPFPHGHKVPGHHPPRQRDFTARPDARDVTQSLEHPHASAARRGRRSPRPRPDAPVDPPRISPMSIRP